jgi:hypothetical protein
VHDGVQFCELGGEFGEGFLIFVNCLWHIILSMQGAHTSLGRNPRVVLTMNAGRDLSSFFVSPKTLNSGIVGLGTIIALFCFLFCLISDEGDTRSKKTNLVK